MTVAEVEPMLLQVEDAARVAGVSRSMAYQMLKEGQWPRVIVGKSIRVPLEGLRQWIEDNTTYGK